MGILFTVEQLSTVWMDHSLPIQSPTGGHLCCFQFLAITNKAAMNIGMLVHVD